MVVNQPTHRFPIFCYTKREFKCKGDVMALLELDHTRAHAADPGLSVVLCGSFRRDPASLRRTYDELRQSFNVLSPAAVDFVDTEATFVRLPSELRDTEQDIEAKHLRAMTSADFVWLHAPDGYVGTSAAMELGHAAALGVPVFASTTPREAVLADNVHLADHPSTITRGALEQAGLPGRGLGRLQTYYARTAMRRGWADETVQDTLILLTEELRELTGAIQKSEDGVRPQDDPDADVAGELADVQLYLVHLANALGMDLGLAVTHKERVNARRFDLTTSVA